MARKLPRSPLESGCEGRCATWSCRTLVGELFVSCVWAERQEAERQEAERVQTLVVPHLLPEPHGFPCLPWPLPLQWWACWPRASWGVVGFWSRCTS